MVNGFSRKTSFFIIGLTYVFASLLGVICYVFCKQEINDAVLSLLVADIVATVYVWAVGLLFKNVSVYDPYWSVAPPIILTGIAIEYGNYNAATLLLLLAIWYWAIRLTANWAFTFKGLSYEDWRYTKYRDSQSPFVFHLINFFGLNLMPTLVVFAVLLPGYYMISGDWQINWLTVLGAIISMFAATIQLVADTQAHRFRREHQGQVCNVGLWKNGRHPNYFGEILMWWGVWLMYFSVAGWHYQPWLICGAVVNTLMFLCISIPLMESRQLKNKPAYADYRKHTRLFI